MRAALFFISSKKVETFFDRHPYRPIRIILPMLFLMFYPENAFDKSLMTNNWASRCYENNPGQKFFIGSTHRFWLLAPIIYCVYLLLL